MGETLKERLDRLNRLSKSGKEWDVQNFAFDLIGAYRSGDLTPRDEITPQMAAEVLLRAMADGLDPMDPDRENSEVEGLAIKWSGNRGDGVIQLEIAEEFFRAALAAIKESKDEN